MYFFDSQREKDNAIIKLIQSAWEAEAEEKSGFEFEVRDFLSKIIYMISEGKSGKIYSPTNRDLRDMQRTKLMITFLEKNFAENLHLSQIAKVAAISESECQRCFKRSTGFSPIQFLKEYRILRAAEKMQFSRQNISDIANECGFLDMSYFAKTFKQIFKMSPTEYRQQNNIFN